MRKLTPNFALLDAIRRGSAADIRQAMLEGANINCRTFYGKTTLQHAMRYARNEQVDLLVTLGADIEQVSGKRSNSLLHTAALTGNIGFTSALLRNHADPNAQNSLGQTPLYVAARHGYEYIARALLDAGADPSLCTHNGLLPETAALMNSHTTIARILFDKRTSLSAGGSWSERVAAQNTKYGHSKSGRDDPSR